MHEIEPFWSWRQYYTAEDDELSPFYGREYSEFEFTDRIYNHVIHPQWDHIGSETLFVKLLYADYDEGAAVLELMGEWNDCLHNDVMHLKRNVADNLMRRGITKFILIGENVVNFHASDDSYYEEWFDEVEEGWIALLNFHEHVMREFADFNIDSYFLSGGELEMTDWRTVNPETLINKIGRIAGRRLKY